MRRIIIGWTTITSSLGSIASVLLIMTFPLVLSLLIAIGSYVALSLNAYEIGNLMMKLTNAFISFIFTPIFFAPIKLLAIGLGGITILIVLVDIFAPSFLEKKILEKNAFEYVLHRLKGEHDTAERIEREIAQMDLKILKSKMIR